MYPFYDADEWETVTESRPCTACGGDSRKCNGRCNGASLIGTRRRAPEEVARIKAERRQREEDEILRRAEEIRARRAALASTSAQDREGGTKPNTEKEG